MATIRGKISQEGTEAPVIVLFGSPGILFTTEFLQDGEYRAVCNHNILNSDMPPKWFVADSSGSIYAISQVNQTDLIIQVYDKTGNPSNGRLSGNEFKIETS